MTLYEVIKLKSFHLKGWNRQYRTSAGKFKDVFVLFPKLRKSKLHPNDRYFFKIMIFPIHLTRKSLIQLEGTNFPIFSRKNNF